MKKVYIKKGTISEVIEDIKDKRWKQDICYIGHLKKEITLLKHENEELKIEVMVMMNKLWIVVHDKEAKKTWWKYFENESEMDKFINRIKWIKNLLIIEDSRDIIWR